MSVQEISLPGFAETFVRLGSDVSNATATLADATGLSFIADANSDYMIEFSIIYNAPLITDGINLAVNGPVSPVSVPGLIMVPGSVTPNAVIKPFTSYDLSNIFTDNSHALLNHAKVNCNFRNGLTAGTFILRFAKESAGTGTITIKTGSLLRYKKISA